MRVRALDVDGDMKFGNSQGDFLVNSPEAVAQTIGTRLRLWTGEWFLDLDEGTPYSTKILGTHTGGFYDFAFQSRILGSPGVISLASYQSRLDPATRQLTFHADVNTQYGTTPSVVATSIPS